MSAIIHPFFSDQGQTQRMSKQVSLALLRHYHEWMVVHHNFSIAVVGLFEHDAFVIFSHIAVFEKFPFFLGSLHQKSVVDKFIIHMNGFLGCDRVSIFIVSCGFSCDAFVENYLRQIWICLYQKSQRSFGNSGTQVVFC